MRATWNGSITTLNRVPLAAISSREKRFAIVHQGGPAPGSDSAIKGAFMAANVYGVDLVGFHGFKGILTGDAILLKRHLTARMESQGSISSGTSRFNPKDSQLVEIAEKLKGFGISGLIAIGGDDTNTIAARIFEKTGFPVVGVPKTIDNDLLATVVTHGFRTVVDNMTREVRTLKDDAACQDQPACFIVRLMGRGSGAIGLETGRAANATGIFLPEEFTMEGLRQILGSDFILKDQILARISRMLAVKGEILDTVRFVKAIEGKLEPEELRLDGSLLAKEIVRIMDQRSKMGAPYGVFIIPEGIVDKSLEVIERTPEGRPKKYRVLGFGDPSPTIEADESGNPKLSKFKMEDRIAAMTEMHAKMIDKFVKGKELPDGGKGQELKVVPIDLGYQYRCAAPNSWDVNLGQDEGQRAVDLLTKGIGGVMVILKGDGNTGYVPYKDLQYNEHGHLVPRPVNLRSSAYYQSIVMQCYKMGFHLE